MERILIVGGAGYLGGAVVDFISQEKPDAYIKVYDNLLFERQYLKRVPFQFGDIRDRHALLSLIEGEEFDTIIWLAAMVGDPLCQHNPDLAREINEDSVKWLSGVVGDRHVIFISSCSVYGKNKKQGLIETDDADPLSIYAETKLNAERYLQDCNSIILRLGTLYGMGDQFARLRFDLVVNRMTGDLIRHGRLTVRGGDQMRPLVNVKDIARVIYEGTQKKINGIYNVTKYNMRIDELANTIRDAVGAGEIEITEREQQGLDERDYSVSSEKFNRTFKTQLIHPIESSVAKIAHAVREKRIKNHDNAAFNNLLNVKGGVNE